MKDKTMREVLVRIDKSDYLLGGLYQGGESKINVTTLNKIGFDVAVTCLGCWLGYIASNQTDSDQYDHADIRLREVLNDLLGEFNIPQDKRREVLDPSPEEARK